MMEKAKEALSIAETHSSRLAKMIWAHPATMTTVSSLCLFLWFRLWILSVKWEAMKAVGEFRLWTRSQAECSVILTLLVQTLNSARLSPPKNPYNTFNYTDVTNTSLGDLEILIWQLASLNFTVCFLFHIFLFRSTCLTFVNTMPTWRTRWYHSSRYDFAQWSWPSMKKSARTWTINDPWENTSCKFLAQTFSFSHYSNSLTFPSPIFLSL
jgi:hypothetical protein